jgi:hypothetical protein
MLDKRLDVSSDLSLCISTIRYLHDLDEAIVIVNRRELFEILDFDFDAGKARVKLIH